MLDRWLERQSMRTLVVMFLFALIAIGAGITLLSWLLGSGWLYAILWGGVAIAGIMSVLATSFVVKVIVRMVGNYREE